MAITKTEGDIDGWAITVSQEDCTQDPTVTVWVGWSQVDGMSTYAWNGRRIAMFAQEWCVLPGTQEWETHSGWCVQRQSPMPWWAWNIVKIRLRQEENGVY